MPDKLVNWNTIKLTDNQVAHIELLMRFHLAESQNDVAKERTKKLQWCFKNWMNKDSAYDKEA